ncbi:hypothetical protein ACFYUV_11300 [Nonomuraea sp. NPDC003560]|uniref:hypothetical protein n=1 Tax=Nonomuraea sp. NPDC003560 TaxID=3364341 RepID=UPI0036909AF5
MTESEKAARQTHYEIELDAEPEPDAGKPVYADVVTEDHEARPIIPAALRRGNRRPAARRFLGRLAHRLGYHSLRTPWYAALALWWAPAGAWKVLAAAGRWAFDSDTMSRAKVTPDAEAALKFIEVADKHRRHRLPWFIIGLACLLVSLLVLARVSPWWVQAGVLAAVLPLLAKVGHPVDQRIVHAAVVAPRFRKMTPDVVLRGYYAAGLGHPDKKDQQVTFGSVMRREGDGSAVLIDLPYGKGFGHVVKAKEDLASGLDVAVSQVFLTRDPSSNRRHKLWVADRDPLSIPAGRTPLLKLQPTDIWQPAPLGLDERGQAVTLLMMWVSILVGAQPRQGKSFTARLLALYAALDPYVKLCVFDGKGSPDWRKFALVADRFSFGFAMSRDGDPLEIFVETLRELKAEVQWRYQRLSELPVDVCPEGKLTRDLARDPRYGMPVRLVVIDECQEYFDTGDKELDKEISGLLVFLVKVAPAAGVIVLDATQKPGGVGSGEIATRFTAFRDQHQVRIGLRTGSYQVSDMVLGSGSSTEGYDTSTLLPTYKGVGMLRGASDDTPTVRFHLADAGDAEKILTYARTLREKAGTLSGMAAGEEAVKQARDVLYDVQQVFYGGEDKLTWRLLAERLREQLPEGYASETQESISAKLRELGVASENVRDSVTGDPLKGCKLAAVKQAAERRAIESNGGGSGRPVLR